MGPLGWFIAGFVARSVKFADPAPTSWGWVRPEFWLNAERQGFRLTVQPGQEFEWSGEFNVTPVCIQWFVANPNGLATRLVLQNGGEERFSGTSSFGRDPGRSLVLLKNTTDATIVARLHMRLWEWGPTAWS